MQPRPAKHLEALDQLAKQQRADAAALEGGSDGHLGKLVIAAAAVDQGAGADGLARGHGKPDLAAVGEDAFRVRELLDVGRFHLEEGLDPRQVEPAEIRGQRGRKRQQLDVGIHRQAHPENAAKPAVAALAMQAARAYTSIIPAPSETPMAIHDSILSTVGNTPVVRINRLAPEGVEMYVKVEAFNPLSSVKDRLALGVIEDAERRGVLKPGMTVVEATSGNTGIGLAMVCAAK